MEVQTYRHTDVRIPPVFYRTLSPLVPSGAAAQKPDRPQIGAKSSPLSPLELIGPPCYVLRQLGDIIWTLIESCGCLKIPLVGSISDLLCTSFDIMGVLDNLLDV